MAEGILRVLEMILKTTLISLLTFGLLIVGIVGVIGMIGKDN